MSALTTEHSHQIDTHSWHERLRSRAAEIIGAFATDNTVEALGIVELEDKLSELEHQAEVSPRVNRRIRRQLSDTAEQLLILTDQNPDVHDRRSLGLIGKAADMSGRRELLTQAAEQGARMSDSSSSNFSLQVIQAALEQDKPYAEMMSALNEKIGSAVMERYEEPHKPLGPEYNFLFDLNEDGTIHNYKERQHSPLFKDND